MRNLGILSAAVIGLAAMVAGCGGGSSGSGDSTHHGSMHSESTHTESHHGTGGMAMDDMCPMQVAGTTVAATDVEGGVALGFTTSSGDVSELRRRVTHMAEMHNQEHAAGRMMPAATASAEDAEGGARMILRPTDPAQLDALREHAHTHAERMSHGECPMMAEGGGGHGMHGMQSQGAPPPAQ